MAAPYDYSLGNIPSPFDAFTQGMQRGTVMQQVQAQQQAQAQAAQDQQALQAELAAASADPRMIPGIMVRYPQLAEKLKIGLESMTAEQQRGQLAHGAEVASALASGRPDVAIKSLKSRAEALRNSGDERGAKAAEDAATWAESDPTSLLSATIGRMNAMPGGDKVSEGILKLFDEKRKAELQPAAVAKATADATTAGVKAKYAESDAVMDLEKKGWDITKIKADIAYQRESNRIAAMNAAAGREGNDLKRQELKMKIDDAVKARDDKVRDKVATAEAGAANIDNMLNTIQRIKKNPSLNDVVGSIEGRLPVVFSDEAADAAALIETLGSQAFLAQIPSIKGMGALSNAEGDKLQNALQNLSRVQSEKQFVANLEEAARILTKGRESLSKSTGVPLGKPDTPAAPGARPPLSSFAR
jgi:hypothetical protein